MCHNAAAEEGAVQCGRAHDGGCASRSAKAAGTLPRSVLVQILVELSILNTDEFDLLHYGVRVFCIRILVRVVVHPR